MTAPVASAPTIDARADALWRRAQRFIRSALQTDTVAGAVTLTDAYGTVLGDATGGAFAVTLPPAAELPGWTFRVKKVDASANAVTVTASGTDRIDGAATFPLAVQYQSVTVQSDGSAWWVL